MEASLFDGVIDDLEEQARSIAEQLAALPLPERIEALNRVRTVLHEVSPFQDEPVDLVLWVRGEQVEPNDYNPNVVYRPEMRLLETSIQKDHFTQPVVTHTTGNGHIIVDGEHRYIVATTNKRVTKQLHGYLPVTVTRSTTEEERMASTIRHNRARGVHRLDNMTDIVLSMLREDWTDDEVARQLGMDADEILRLKQVSGIAKAFERPAYNRARVNDDGQETLD